MAIGLGSLRPARGPVEAGEAASDGLLGCDLFSKDCYKNGVGRLNNA